MIRSMTGFGDASSHVGGVHYFVELRSINNKYFKATMRLPESLAALDAELESTLRKRLDRGTVTLTASYSENTPDAALQINAAALDRYAQQLRASEMVRSGAVTFDAAALLNLPGVLQPPGDEEERLDRHRAALMPLLEQACDKLIEMRAREGQALKADLLTHRDTLRTCLDEISALAPGVAAQYEERLQSRIRSLLAELELKAEPADIVREVAVYAEKTDIAEEVARLSAHIDQFTELVSPEDARPVGRTLEFLTQEMLREANTIASKSPDARIARLSVQVKGTIDRIKEQVFNVE